MTPEERAATIHLDSICRDDFGTDDYDEVRADIADAIRHAKAEAYGESMRAICEHCRQGIPVVSVFGFGQGADGRNWTTWHRGENGVHAECIAAPIHHLVDSLVQSRPAS